MLGVKITAEDSSFLGETEAQSCKHSFHTSWVTHIMKQRKQSYLTSQRQITLRVLLQGISLLVPLQCSEVMSHIL